MLLKSSASDPRGFTCKLSDFGLVNLLRAEDEQEDGGEGAPGEAGPPGGIKPSMRNSDSAGTVRLQGGGKGGQCRGGWCRGACLVGY